MTTMIALVGGQTLPNVLPVLHYKPLNTLFIYTDTTREQYKYLKGVLEKKNFNVYGIETDPYDISAIARALNDDLANTEALSSQPLVFNLTGGTKTMSLAAYQIAAQRNAPVIYLQSEKGQSMIDYYIWQDHLLYHQKREQLTTYLTLHDVLELQLGPQKDTMGKDRWTVGTIIQTDGGHLFELAIAQVLRDHSYEEMCGVKNKNNNVDIDVMIRYQNQVGIIEAKTSETGKVKKLYGVKQLSTATRYLGGTYIRQFLVINGGYSEDLQIMCEILKIPIISLPHYKQGMTTLPQEDIDILLAEIDKVMKVK